MSDLNIFQKKLMISGIGIDLISVDRIANLNRKFGLNFAKKILSQNEIKFLNLFIQKQDSQAKNFSIKNEFSSDKFFKIKSVENFLAKRFAAKEAFAKAIGLGIGRGINFEDVEIYNDSLGAPRLAILNDKVEFLKTHLKVKDFVMHLSFSDQGSDIVAVVLVERL